MKKININGTKYVSLNDLNEILRYHRKDADNTWSLIYNQDRVAGMKFAYDFIIRDIYREELAQADESEEEAIIEMPGDFIVYKHEGKFNSAKIMYFCCFNDGPVFSNDSKDAMHFAYESKAVEVADSLGEDWKVLNTSREYYERDKRLLSAIFGN